MSDLVSDHINLAITGKLPNKRTEEPKLLEVVSYLNTSLWSGVNVLKMAMTVLRDEQPGRPAASKCEDLHYRKPGKKQLAKLVVGYSGQEASEDNLVWRRISQF